MAGYGKIAEGLYLAEYDSYDYNQAITLLNERTLPAFPDCSVIRCGAFSGRNYDWHVNGRPVTVVKIGRSCTNYASIGIVGNYIREYGTDDEMLRILPLLVCDGINEKGLQVSICMVPSGQSSHDPEKWRHGEWGLGAAYTHPEMPEAQCSYGAARYILDKAAGVREAIGLIERGNWFDPRGFFASGGRSVSFHWMISDERESAVVEFIDNRMEYSITDAINQPSSCTVMTNFYHALLKDGIFPRYASGYERYDLMKEQYASAADEGGLCKVLESVRMSLKYRKELTDKHFFATDFVFDHQYSGKCITTEQLYRGNGKSDPDFIATVQDAKARYAGRVGWGTKDCWEHITIYTSIYDIPGKKVKLLLLEGMDGDNWYEFKL